MSTDPTPPAAVHASGPHRGKPVAQHPATVAELLTKLAAPDVPTAYQHAHQLGIRLWELAGDMEPDDPDALHGSLLEKATALLGEVAVELVPARPVEVLEDALCRRVWAAAYRAAAARIAGLHDAPARVLLDDVESIERGDLTPWADQPEPADPVTPSPGDEGGTQSTTTPSPPGLCEATVHDRAGEPKPCGRQRPCPVHDQPASWEDRIRAQHPEMSTDAVARGAHAAGVLFGAVEPPDPTHGRIDRDIQDEVTEMRPTSLGQRVAIENTLQARRDARRPAQPPRHFDDGDPAPVLPEDPDAPAQPAGDGPAATGPTPGTPDGGALDLDAIQARADAATPGPWRLDSGGPHSDPQTIVLAPDDGDGAPVIHHGFGDHDPDAEFIAAARQDVPALLAEVRRLAAAGFELADRNSKLRGHLNRVERELAELRAETPEPQRNLASDAVTPTEPAVSLVPGILGRALLDRRQRVWLSAGEPAGAYWTLGAAQGWWTVEAIEEDAGGRVREVLLVSPSAGRVLDAARAWRRVDGPLAFADETAAAVAELRAGVDAHAADQPAEPAPDTQPLPSGVYPAGSWSARPTSPPSSSPVGQPSNTAPEPDDGPGWDRSAVEALLARSGADATDHELRQVVALLANRDYQQERRFALSQIVSEAWDERDAFRAELAEERAQLAVAEGGRDRLQRIVDSTRGYDLDRLRADRDSWQARAELAESRLDGQAWEDLTAERDGLLIERDNDRASRAAAARSARDSAAYAEQGWAEVDRLRSLLTEEAERHGRHVLTAQRTCADDLHRALCLPDTGTDWQGHRSWADWWAELTHGALPRLLSQHRRRATVIDHQAGELERVRGEVATARRDAAELVTVTRERDKLRSWAAERAYWQDRATRAEAACRDAVADTLEWADSSDNVSDGWTSLAQVAAEIRAGTRPVPGSPQPARAGGEEPT